MAEKAPCFYPFDPQRIQAEMQQAVREQLKEIPPVLRIFEVVSVKW
jgi:hypothetical protein